MGADLMLRVSIVDNNSDDRLKQYMLLKKTPFFNMNCLQMAVESESYKFVSLPVVQDLFNEIWYGKIKIEKNRYFKIKVEE